MEASGRNGVPGRTWPSLPPTERALRDQAGGRAGRRHEGRRAPAAARSRRARPHRARPGRDLGTGIFVVIGEAIGDAGPAIILSFVLAGVTCAFSALAFAELASTIPVAGSAYTYSYATLGEIAAWIIGWDLILEYAVSVAAVAVGWGQYFNDLADSLFGFTLPDSLAAPPGDAGSFNLPA